MPGATEALHRLAQAGSHEEIEVTSQLWFFRRSAGRYVGIDHKWGLVLGTTVQSIPYFFPDTSRLGLALRPGRGGESP